MEIFRLVGSILVDSSSAEKSLSSTGKQADTLGNKLASGIKTALKWGTAIAGAVSAVGGAVVGFAKSASESLDEVDKGAQRMGVSTTKFQEFQHVCDLTGVSMNTLEKATKKLEGTDIDFTDAINQIYSLETAEERSAKAVELFGSSIAYELTPMLNASASELADMRQEAHDLGLVMSEDAVKSGAEMGDMFSKLESSIGAMKQSLMVEFMPYIMEILQFLIDEIPIVQEAIKKFLDWIMPYVKPVMEGLMSFLKAIFALLDGDFDGFIEGLKDMLVNLIPVFLNLGKSLLTALWEGIKTVWEKLKEWVKEKIEWLKGKLTFWKKGTDDMSTDEVDGSHASGNFTVPYDNYVARLHRGESINNAGATQRLLEKIENLQFEGGNNPIELSINLDGKAFAKATYSSYQSESRRQGSSLVMV